MSRARATVECIKVRNTLSNKVTHLHRVVFLCRKGSSWGLYFLALLLWFYPLFLLLFISRLVLQCSLEVHSLPGNSHE